MLRRVILLDLTRLRLPADLRPKTLGDILPYARRYVCTCGFRTDNRNTWKSHRRRGKAGEATHLRANSPLP
jgi:hypothetical protein